MKPADNLETVLPIPSGLDAAKVPVAEEVHRLHESAMWSAQGQFEQTKLWRLANICLGVPAAALAALAGGVGLASDGKLTYASVMALVAAALSAALTTLNPSRRITQSHGASNAYLEIQTAARQLLTIDLPHLSYDECLERLSELTARRDEVNKTADPPGRIARKRAARNISSGGQSYQVDRMAGKD
jgi:hypothetical protein